ncbi:helix-turn-helix domain-containing protein [Streptomyces sp. NPDC006208]|uniref:helix-turn-helix domain-containing protein n=1 Tax=Streptomyces sp. NPDC006208 TaxID=3156734 RepID=UPI0033A95BDD
MKIPAAVVELLHQGFNNREIAERTGIHKSTIAAHRHRLGLPNAKRRRAAHSLERLYAEAVPTGQVRDWKPARLPLTPAQQAANRATLLAALRAA